MTQPPEAGDLQAVERAVRRAALAELICDYLRDGKTWCDEDGMVNGEHSLADAIMELDAPRSQSALSPAPSQGDVEAVARALYEEDDPWHKAWPWPNLNPEAQGGQGAADAYRRLARAAIAAMPVSAGLDRFRQIVEVIAEADSEDTIGSLSVDIPKGGYPRQWLRDAAKAALSDDDGKEGR